MRSYVPKKHYLKNKKSDFLSIFEKKSLGVRNLCCTTNFAKRYLYVLPV